MPVKYCNLTDKVAIVTGASRGIGEAIAKQFSSCGAKIILIARNSDQLVAVKETINSNGGIAESMVGDVSNLNSISEIVTNAIDKWGQIDILVNNAGIARDNILNQLENPVLWCDTILNLKQMGITDFYEAGPGKVLKGLNRQIFPESTTITCDKLEHLDACEVL